MPVIRESKKLKYDFALYAKKQLSYRTLKIPVEKQFKLFKKLLESQIRIRLKFRKISYSNQQ